MKRYLYIIAFFQLIVFSAFADDVKFSAKSKTVVSEGEKFRVTYEINSQGTNFKAPSFNGFNVIMGPSTSSNTSMQFINGQMTHSSSYTYTYLLQAVKEGKYDIPAAEITVNNQKYQSNALKIEVVKGTPPQNTSNQTTNNQTNTNQADVSGEELFVRMHVSRSELFQGEHLIATIKVYTKVNLVGFENMKYPSFDGFWTQDIELPVQIQLVPENVDGQNYNVGVIRQVVLFPQKSGELNIDPFELECVVQKRVNSNSNSFFNSFFGGYQNVKKTVVSPKVKVKVNALPGKKPADFKGAVGNFKMESECSPLEVKTNEPVNLKIKISGNGNHKLVDLPVINFPQDFELYDPQITENISTNAAGVNGTKSAEYLLIPRHAGTFTIPPVSFSYFDVQSKSFKTLTTEEYVIHVTKGEGGENEGFIVNNFAKEDVRFVGSDIRYIKTTDVDLKKNERYLVASLLYYLSFIIAIGLFTFIIIWKRKQIRQRANQALMKNKKANSVAKKRLKLSAKYMAENNSTGFFEEVSKALWGYISDKLNIPLSELSRENTNQALKEKNISEPVIISINSLIDKCEFARYAPAGDISQMDSVYNEAVQLITNLENNL